MPPRQLPLPRELRPNLKIQRVVFIIRPHDPFLLHEGVGGSFAGRLGRGCEDGADGGGAGLPVADCEGEGEGGG